VSRGELRLLVLAFIVAGAVAAPAPRAEDAHEGHRRGSDMAGMDMDAAGMVMNANADRLPRDCPSVSRDVRIVVHAGRALAARYPGTMFAFDSPLWEVPGCARVTVTLVNEDHVRHQWMLHGLPRYLYPEGMFHLEVAGPGERSGTFIVPSGPKTYLVHCDVPQHAEKGMKAELKVAGGDGDLSSIPGLTSPLERDFYPVKWNGTAVAAVAVGGLVGVLIGVAALRS
jgi:hypothetical protein